MSKTPKLPRDPWRPKKPKKDLRVQFSTWTTQSAKALFDKSHTVLLKKNPNQKPGDTLAAIIEYAEAAGFNYFIAWQKK